MPVPAARRAVALQPATEYAIEAYGLRKTYRTRKGRRNAVDGLDLKVPVGGVHGFLGPNGSGKTTTIRMVLGLIAANAALKLRMGGDIKGDLILLAILVGFSLIVSLGSMYWLIQIGSALGAGAAAWVISAAPQQNRSRTQLLGVAAIWLAGLALVGVRILV